LGLKHLKSLLDSELDKVIVKSLNIKEKKGGNLKAFEFKVLMPETSGWISVLESYESFCGTASIHCNRDM
jgi:hypothetical protein